MSAQKAELLCMSCQHVLFFAALRCLYTAVLLANKNKPIMMTTMKLSVCNRPVESGGRG